MRLNECMLAVVCSSFALLSEGSPAVGFNVVRSLTKLEKGNLPCTLGDGGLSFSWLEQTSISSILGGEYQVFKTLGACDEPCYLKFEAQRKENCGNHLSGVAEI